VSARATLRDVARLAQVHPGTVSRALNEETRALVNPETARRVIEAAQALGYQANPIARGLKTNRSYTVGVLIPDLMNPLFPPIVRGIQDGLEQAGYTPLLANTDNDPEREAMDLRAMRARQVDGFITATARRDHGVLQGIMDAGVPVVLVNRRMDDAALPSVTSDDRAGIALAVEHLVGLGHTRIAHLGGSQALSTGRARALGFRDALARAGLDVDAPVLTGEAFTSHEGERLCRELLEQGPAPTAIVAGNDLMALGCIDVLRDAGLECPGDVSLVGYNDMPFADRFVPPLTTVRVPHYEIGAAAAALMLETLTAPGGEPRQVQLPAELVVRSSTAPPRT
jgi:LacI family transcriptional regulator